MKVFCKNCMYLENYGTGMTEGPQWACHAPSGAVDRENWLCKWVSHKFFGIRYKPWWKNRKKNCFEFAGKEEV